MATLHATPQVRHARSPADGGRIAYTVCGTGPPLVLLHPIGLNRTWWAEHAEALAENHRVIAIDLAGHGTSDRAQPGSRLQDLARGVLSVLDAEAVEGTHIVGVSMGGMIAQHVALLQPDRVAAMILCSTTGGFTAALRPVLAQRGLDAMTADGMAAVVDSTLDRWFSPPERTAGIRRRCTDTLLAQDPANWAACWHAISQHDALPQLHELAMPVLVLTGTADTSTPPAAAAALAQALPNAQLHIIDDAPHLGIYEAGRPFLEEFTKFLAQQRRDGRAAARATRHASWRANRRAPASPQPTAAKSCASTAPNTTEPPPIPQGRCHDHQSAASRTPASGPRWP